MTVTPDHSNWEYRRGEQAKLQVELSDEGKPVKDAYVRFQLMEDKMPVFRTDSVRIVNGKGVIEVGTMYKPGFIRCNVNATLTGKFASSTVTLGFDPLAIVPTTTLPDDFTAFWERNKQELARIPLDLKMDLVPERCTDKVNVYHASARNIAGRVYGMLCVPKAEGKYPAVLVVPGAGARAYQGDVKMAEKGFITFEMGIHGVPVNLPDELYNALRQGALDNSAGYAEYNLDDRETYYYRRVYMGCVRSVDMLTSLPQYDGKHIAVTGGSQGGGLSLVTAGLDNRIQALVCFFPALCDLTGYFYGRAGGWPHMFAPSKWQRHFTTAKVNTSKYFDAVNFARGIKVPGFYSWGFNDGTCPPTSTYSAYNVVTAPKEIHPRPANGHSRSGEDIILAQEWIMKQFGTGTKEAGTVSAQESWLTTP
jgi:cephalosporin-C deacetylase-like acetyl esterase